MDQQTNVKTVLYDAASIIAEQLDSAGVHWAFGSSFVLRAHGLVEQPRDLDIFVALKDWDKAVAVMNSLGKSIPREPKAPYETTHFSEYVLSAESSQGRLPFLETSETLSLDLISGFAVRHSAGLFDYDLCESEPLDQLTLEWPTGKRVFPFIKLEDWYLMYQLLPEREKKVRLIEKHLSLNLDIEFRETLLDEDCVYNPKILSRLNALLEKNLPDDVIERILAFCHRQSVHTYSCSVAYDGKRYSGWQTQKNHPTVQQTIEKKIGRVIGHKVNIQGSGRTDAGVHARGQVFSFITVMPLPLPKFLVVVNRLLPTDIVVNHVEEVRDSFHARFDAKGKTYRYRIWNGEARDVFEAEYSWHIPQKLDLAAMQKAAEHMVGTHDFKSFMASGSTITDTVRTVYSVTVKQSGDIVEMDFQGNGFLYNMVRIMSGILVQVGVGKRNPDEVASIIKAENRRLAPLTAPPQGLYLMSVEYEE